MTTPNFDYTTAEGQKRMQRSADQRVLDLCKAFNEIQSGPNPLSPDDVRKLIDRRPDRYWNFEVWATPQAVA